MARFKDLATRFSLTEIAKRLMRKDPHRDISQDQCAHLNTAGQSQRPKKFEKNQYFSKGLVTLKLGVRFEIDKLSRCFNTEHKF